MAHPTGIEQLLAFFAVVHDPRRQHATTWHPLETILTITILATICGAQNWVEIAHWGHAKAAWLSEFLDLAHGIPSHDTFGRVFALLDPSTGQSHQVSDRILSKYAWSHPARFCFAAMPPWAEGS